MTQLFKIIKNKKNLFYFNVHIVFPFYTFIGLGFFFFQIYFDLIYTKVYCAKKELSGGVEKES